MNITDNVQQLKQNENISLPYITSLSSDGQHKIVWVFQWQKWKPEGEKLRRFLSADDALRYTVPGLRPISLFSTYTTVNNTNYQQESDLETGHIVILCRHKMEKINLHINEHTIIRSESEYIRQVHDNVIMNTSTR